MRRDGTRRVWVGGAVWAALLVVVGPVAAAAEPSFAGHFPQAPEKALIRLLQDGPAWEHPGLALSRSVRPAPDLKGVLLYTQVNNRGKETCALPEVPVLDLGFRIHDRPEDSPFEPLKRGSGEWYGSTFWTGPNWTRVGKDWHHPGEQTPSVRTFRAPRDGRVALTGRVYKLHKDGDGVRLSIRHGAREVWQAEIDGADGQGVEPKVALDVRTGDAVRFIVHRRGTISCDTTFWDPVVTYADGERLQASESFAAARQGEGNWFYEMLLDGSEARKDPTAYGLTPGFALRGVRLGTGASLEWRDGDALPFLAVSDGKEESGVLLALGAAGGHACRASLGEDGILRVTLSVRPEGTRLAPGETLRLPVALLAAYEGPWTASVALLERLAGEPALAPLAAGIRDGCRRAVASLRRPPSLPLLLLAQAEWHRDDGITEDPERYEAATLRQIEKTGKLLEDLRRDHGVRFLAAEGQRLAGLSREAAKGEGLETWRRLYLQARLLKRSIALANPLLDFRALLFCKRVPPSWSHLVAQYFGWRQRPGGGLFVLQDPGYSLETREVVGRQLPPGSFLEPRLSYDGRRVLFSFVAVPPEGVDPARLAVNEEGPDEFYFHLYEASVDGTGLRQLTAGPYDDLFPEYLPDGRILFCSTRRKGYSRCFGPEYSRRWHSYTLHRANADGTGLRALSFNDVSEWFPALSNTGHVLFARWDYIDRDAVTHQNLWAARPDGTNPVAVWGNAAPSPHCVFQARPVPGSPKIAFIASAHHSITAGPLCLLDPGVDANSLAAVQRITPGPFPEVESGHIPEYCESPWPLSESIFLVAYSRDRLRFQGEHERDPNPDNALGLYLLDADGNRELIYRDPHISATSPIPLRPRPKPPVLADSTSGGDEGEMVVMDVYEGLGDVPRGTIKEIRVVQILPKTTYVANNPRIGAAGEENTRAILGTVPVEPDGSARFTVPAGKPLLFQALDGDGMAYQTMRSTTYVQPGESVSCIGCHEHRMAAPPARRAMALRRPPSSLRVGELDGEPFSFARAVQPVLDRSCVSCHGEKDPKKGIDLTGRPDRGFTRSYWSLCGAADAFDGGKTNPENAAAALVPRFGQRNQVQVTPPGGLYGARGSRLMKMLRAGHQGVKLTDAELRRLAAWIDCNAVFHGSYHPSEQARQLAGEQIPLPSIK